jgi:hypothetical protein
VGLCDVAYKKKAIFSVQEAVSAAERGRAGGDGGAAVCQRRRDGGSLGRRSEGKNITYLMTGNVPMGRIQLILAALAFGSSRSCPHSPSDPADPAHTRLRIQPILPTLAFRSSRSCPHSPSDPAHPAHTRLQIRGQILSVIIMHVLHNIIPSASVMIQCSR